MVVSTALVLADGFSFMSLLVLAFIELYVVTNLLDLKQDYISAKDMCDRINPMLLPTYVYHIIVTVMILLSGKWVQFLFELPLLFIIVRRVLTEKIKFDYLSIRRTDELNQMFKLHCVFIGYYAVGFIFAFVVFDSSTFNYAYFLLSYSFLIDLIRRIENR